MLCTAHAIASSDTFSVFFRTNESVLTEGVRNQLDGAIYNGAISYSDAIWLIGYADEVGSIQGNLRLSRARASTVKTYLVKSGFRPAQITLVEGKGKAGARETLNGDGYPRDRRVDIVKAPMPVAQALPVEAPPPPVNPIVPPPAPPAAPVAIDLGKVATGESIKLENIYFEAGRHYFRTGAYKTLEALYQSLKDNPTVRIKIEGHVCCTPETDIDGEDVDTHKLELSVNRALEVRKYLIQKGIAADRMEYEGFGRRRPVFKEELTEDQAVANRRVEVRVIN
jgi:outer membrane protein OmpA-like peptidoglycan-associated protein